MLPLAIVKRRDVVEHTGAGRIKISQRNAVGPFVFQRLEETLTHGIVVTATHPAHARLHLQQAQGLLKRIAGVLTATVRMMNRALARQAMARRIMQRIGDQCCRKAVA